MEIDRITLPPIVAPGEVTTFYSFESGAARSVALSSMAILLSSRNNATVPVLMIDWDTEAPSLHHLFGVKGNGPGLLEYFAACREQLQGLRHTHADVPDEERARLALQAVDWEAYVERVDQSRPLYLMRAGCFDDSYGERADSMDWDGLFAACPAIFRSFAAHLAGQFRHVLVDARGGRSAAVSVCTTLLPDKLVALFTPNQRSLEGMAGVVTRALDYRCSHEDEQRPLLVYPVPYAIDSGDYERRLLWRRGDPARGLPGYQAALEKLLRDCYGVSQLSIDSYLDEVQLQQTNATVGGLHLGAVPERDPDRFSLTRTFEGLLDWIVPGRFPWESRAEITLLGAIDQARRACATEPSAISSVPLARDLATLGELYRKQGRRLQAQQCLEESVCLRQRLLGNEHAETRGSRMALAALMRDLGKLQEAKFMLHTLIEDCKRLVGAEHAETLAASTALAATLAQLGEFDHALALHEKITGMCEQRHGPGNRATLDGLADEAATLARQGELSRARMIYERVLEGRQRLLGQEHEDTLRCTQQLASVLSQQGDLANARKLQESVVLAREKHGGPDAVSTLQAREALADILAGQGDLEAVRNMQEALARARERCFGSEHPETLDIKLRLATTLGQQGNHEAARRLQQHVVNLQERIHGMDDLATLHSKKLLAATLSSQGQNAAARKLEETVQQGSSRLQHIRALASGPHEPHSALPAVRAGGDARERGPGDALDDKLIELQKLIDSDSPREARALADHVRKLILRPAVAHQLRQRGVEMIKQVYLQDGDKDALFGFTKDELASPGGAQAEALATRPLALR
jgi:eukaryotic-like serine/threonine-protein kinase